VLDAVDRLIDRPIERRFEPRRAGDPACLVSDNARIMRVLPWRPRFADLETIVRHALAWEKRLSSIRSESARAA
jgi:UDP-glucose 4-epimerase